MTEENKDIQKEEKPKIEGAAQVPASSAPQVAGDASASPVKKEAVVSVKTKPTNCADCNKPIRKKRWYYRNGKYYCSKRCFNNKAKKEAKPEEVKA